MPLDGEKDKKEEAEALRESHSTGLTAEMSNSNFASSSRRILLDDDNSKGSPVTDADERSTGKALVRRAHFRGGSKDGLDIADLAGDGNIGDSGHDKKKKKNPSGLQSDQREESINSFGGVTVDSTRSSNNSPGMFRGLSRSSLLPRSQQGSDRSSMYFGASQSSLMAFFAEPPTLERSESVMSSPLRRFRLMCGTFVEDVRVQIAIIILIIINAILMGVATFDFVTEDADVNHKFDIIDTVFLTIFTIELGLQLIYRGIFLFFDGWLVFDFVIVVTSWSLESLQIIRAFRIFRAFRLVTRIGPLRELVMALGNVMPRLNAIFFMLCLVFYIYSVLFTVLFGDLELSEKYFDTLFHSLFTCMELMTLEWASIAREVIDQENWAWVVFLSYISITGFIVFNLIVAVVCDAVSIVDKQVKDEQDADERAERDGEEIEEPTERNLQEEMDGTQIRIYELTNEVAEMKSRHKAMLAALNNFADEFEKVQALEEEEE